MGQPTTATNPLRVLIHFGITNQEILDSLPPERRAALNNPDNLFLFGVVEAPATSGYFEPPVGIVDPRVDFVINARAPTGPSYYQLSKFQAPLTFEGFEALTDKQFGMLFRVQTKDSVELSLDYKGFFGGTALPTADILRALEVIPSESDIHVLYLKGALQDFGIDLFEQIYEHLDQNQIKALIEQNFPERRSFIQNLFGPRLQPYPSEVYDAPLHTISELSGYTADQIRAVMNNPGVVLWRRADLGALAVATPDQIDAWNSDIAKEKADLAHYSLG